MLNFYYSADSGLLDLKAKRFKKEHPNLLVARKPDPAELLIFLTQKNLTNDTNFFLVDGYSGNIESLFEILSAANLEEKVVLVLYHTDRDIKLRKHDSSLCENRDMKLEALNNKNKRSYINSLIKEYGLKFDPNVSKLIKESLPPKAGEINEFITKISCLDTSRLTEDNLKEIMGEIKLKADYFSFIYLYILGELEEWNGFLIRYIVCDRSFSNLLKSLTYKLMEMRKYIIYRSIVEEPKKVAHRLRKEYYYLFEYETMFQTYGLNILIWLDEFIISLYFFLCRQNKTHCMTIELFRSFLIRQRIKLIKVV